MVNTIITLKIYMPNLQKVDLFKVFLEMLFVIWLYIDSTYPEISMSKFA